MIYKTLKKVSDVCQLLDKSKYPSTRTMYGITTTNNGDGSITINGTATASGYVNCTPPYPKENNGHVFYICANNTTMSKSTWSYGLLNQYGQIEDYGNGVIGKTNASIGRSTGITFNKGIVFDNVIIKPQIIDLTEMYGAGNEPTTVAEFKQKFPNELYDYKPYCFVKSYKTLLKASNVCQLLDKSKYPATQTVNGVTFTNNSDGSITVNGTATSTAFFLLFKYSDSLMPKHKYLLSGSPNNASDNAYIQCYDDTNFQWLRDTGDGGIAIFPKQVVNPSGATNIRIRIEGGYTTNNLVFKPQLFDLTEMYGAGNEPTTVEEFREKFPNELYDYKPYSIITSYKKSFKVTNSILL